MLTKLLAVMFSPIVNLVAWIYRLAAGLLSYALVGMGFICLFATGAELFYYHAMTQEAWLYLALAVGSYTARWVVLVSAGLLLILQEAVEIRAHSPATNQYTA